jgi:hypothetical protein
MENKAGENTLHIQQLLLLSDGFLKNDLPALLIMHLSSAARRWNPILWGASPGRVIMHQTQFAYWLAIRANANLPDYLYTSSRGMLREETNEALGVISENIAIKLIALKYRAI